MEATRDVTFEFQGDRIVFHERNSSMGAKYTLDSSKQPKWIDVDGGGGAMQTGIYKLEGDELTICMGPAFRDGKSIPRPTEFKSNTDNMRGVLVLKRLKKP